VCVFLFVCVWCVRCLVAVSTSVYEREKERKRVCVCTLYSVCVCMLYSARRICVTEIASDYT